MSRVVFLLIPILLIACGGPKELAEAPLKKRPAAVIIKKTEGQAIDYDWFSAKLSGKVTLENGATPVTVNLRMSKDSVIWMSVTALLGIEVARLYITPDSFKLMNRINATYKEGAIDKLNERYGIPLHFVDLERLLTGQFKAPESLKFKSDVVGTHYFLSNKKKREYPKFRFWVDQHFLPYRYELVDLKNQRMQLDYPSFNRVGESWIPTELHFLFESEESSIQATFNYSKVNIDQPKKLKFSIPESYEQMD